MSARAWIQLAWIAPALALLLRLASDATRLARSEIQAVPADEVIAAILAALWIALSFRPRWRGWLRDVGEQLLERVPLALLFALGVLTALAAPSGAWATGAAVSLLSLTAAGALARYRRAPRELAFGAVLLAGNLLLLAGIDWVVGATVLPQRSHNNLFIVHDELLGWKLRPGETVERRHEQYTARETIGPLGFRTPDRPFAKPAGTRRLVVLGDSHTEAYTVSDDETHIALLELALSEHFPVEVIALGVGGYSTDQELLAYLHYGRRFDPDVVLLQFTRNDPPFNALDHYWRGSKPVFRRFGDVLLLTGVPVPDVGRVGLLSDALVEHSSIGRLLEIWLQQLAIERDLDDEVDLDEAWAVTRLLIRDLASAVRGDGARLLAYLALPDAETERRLRAILAELDIPFIETEHVYSDPLESYLVKGHWNPRGQRLIAAELARALRAPLEATGGRSGR